MRCFAFPTLLLQSGRTRHVRALDVGRNQEAAEIRFFSSRSTKVGEAFKKAGEIDCANVLTELL
jgi:hypothetical protein